MINMKQKAQQINYEDLENLISEVMTNKIYRTQENFDLAVKQLFNYDIVAFKTKFIQDLVVEQINEDMRFLYNIKNIKKFVHPARVMAVVKADGYGHGALQAARTALENGASYLGVALIEEGIELREQGIREPILVFGGAFDEQLKEFFDCPSHHGN